VSQIVGSGQTPTSLLTTETTTSTETIDSTTTAPSLTLEYLKSQPAWNPTERVNGIRRISNEEWLRASDGKEFTIKALSDKYWLKFPTPSRDVDREVPTWLFIDGAWRQENSLPNSEINTPFDTAAIQNADMLAILDYNKRPIHQFMLGEDWSLQKMKIYSFGYEGLVLPGTPSTKLNPTDNTITIYLYQWGSMQNTDAAGQQLAINLNISSGELVTGELLPAEIPEFTPKRAY
jgi:hypothetical protein